jgi:hypothetical protein
MSEIRQHTWFVAQDWQTDYYWVSPLCLPCPRALLDLIVTHHLIQVPDVDSFFISSTLRHLVSLRLPIVAPLLTLPSLNGEAVNAWMSVHVRAAFVCCPDLLPANSLGVSLPCRPIMPRMGKGGTGGGLTIST